MFGLFNANSDDSENLTDKGIDRRIDNVGSIRTTPLITGFKQVSEGQLKTEQEKLKRRKEAGKRFQKFLELRKEWEQLDTESTVALFGYLASVYENLTQKRLAPQALKVVQEQSRLAAAKADHKLLETRQKVDSQIAQLQTQRDSLASERGWK